MVRARTHPSVTTVEVVVPGAELRVTGRLDAGNDHALREELHRAIVFGEGELILDLAGAEIHDSTALALVAGVHHRAARAGRTLVIVDPSDRFERVVAAMRLGKVLQRRRRPVPEPVATVTVGGPPARG
ncbi:STAS domain-containing protein [Arsenicicoccus sp. MKL-02]|uniref:STAS domain-containing protein n=1 Tax=Arsenicicoccus cauae TaxID=2663847 RepID=A0A6I3I7W7_9MICO|nr:STAS domain-containing protein [Arsenicicoccus cauae]